MRYRVLIMLTALALVSSWGLFACSRRGESASISEPTLSQGPIYILPADPDSLGKVTVAGIDADTDGVRDDVQIRIHTTYYDSASRSATRQLAEAFQDFLVQGTDKPGALAAAASLNSAIDCLYSMDPENFGDLVDGVEAAVINTSARSKAYARAGAFISGGIFTVSTVADNAASCRETP